MTTGSTGTVTLLFADVEGSMADWQEHSGATRNLLSRYETILRDQILAHGGSVFRVLDDALRAAFSNPLEAIAAAASVQRALQAEPWPGNTQLRVRIALHTGVVDLNAGDYVGLPVNRITGLLAAAHGSQILLSRATQELVRDRLPAGATLRDLGEHHLKDLFRPEHIFQLIAPGLPADFPPLRTLDRQATNLPIQATPLVGRIQDVATVVGMLQRPEVRLLTLTGPGGTGKTRLGLQVAAELLDTFADGVYCVALAALTDPTQVLSAIAQTLGITEIGSRQLPDLIQEYLRDKHLLLLLDNFEQVLDAGAQVAELLEGAAGLKLLITSRALLQLYGEHEYAVPPLALPDLQRLPSLERLTQFEAVRLFIERAKAAKADFTVTDANAPTIAEICVRLDGLPLAIELAAARSKIFAPQALLARLTSRLKLLTGGPRNLPTRQQTLRSTIDWSYNLLNSAERTLFRQLAVFQGGCTLEAIEIVCDQADSQLLDPFDGLVSLVNKSLLRQTEGVDGETRFEMLETIWEYAKEQLEQSEEAETVHRKHATHYMRFVEQAKPELIGPRQQIWLERLEMEHSNVRAAFDWALGLGESEIAARLICGLWRFLWRRNHLVEGHQWVERMLPEYQVLPATLQAKLLRVASILAWLKGDYSESTMLGEASLSLFRELDDRRGVAQVLNHLGTLRGAQGDYVQACALLEEGLDLNRELDNRFGMGVALTNLGFTVLICGEYQRARKLFEEGLALDRALGDRWGMATSQVNLGLVARADGDLEQAQYFFRESLELSKSLGDQTLIATCLEGLAGVVGARDQYASAARLFGTAESLRQVAGTRMPASDYKLHERHLEAARAQLGDEAFAAAWAEGRALTSEQAIAELARPVPPEQPSPPPEAAPQTYPTGLTGREVEILRLVAQGLTNPQIAERLILSLHTVNAHVRSIFGKLAVNSRAAATRFALEQHLV